MSGKQRFPLVTRLAEYQVLYVINSDLAKNCTKPEMEARKTAVPLPTPSLQHLLLPQLQTSTHLRPHQLFVSQQSYSFTNHKTSTYLRSHEYRNLLFSILHSAENRTREALLCPFLPNIKHAFERQEVPPKGKLFRRHGTPKFEQCF